MHLKYHCSHFFFSMIYFSYVSQIKADLVKGVLLGALIAKQKTGHKIIVIPINGGGKSTSMEEEDDMTVDNTMSTTSTTSTTPSPIMKQYQMNMNMTNKQLVQNMKRMAQMLNQLMSQQNTKQSNQPSPAPMSAPKYAPMSGTQPNQMMMMMPVVSMKSMDTVQQPMTAADTHNVQHSKDDYDDYNEKLPQHLSEFKL